MCERGDGAGPDCGVAEVVAAAAAAAGAAAVVEAGPRRAPFRPQPARDFSGPLVGAALAGGGGLAPVPDEGRSSGAAVATPGPAGPESRVPGDAAGLRQQQRRADPVPGAQRSARAPLPDLLPALPTGRRQDGHHQPRRREYFRKSELCQKSLNGR